MLFQWHDGLGDDVDGELVALLHFQRVLQHQDVGVPRGLQPLGAVPGHLDPDSLLVHVVAHKLEHGDGSSIFLGRAPEVRPAADAPWVRVAEIVVEPRARRSEQVTDGTEVHAEVAEHRHGTGRGRGPPMITSPKDHRRSLQSVNSAGAVLKSSHNHGHEPPEARRQEEVGQGRRAQARRSGRAVGVGRVRCVREMAQDPPLHRRSPRRRRRVGL